MRILRTSAGDVMWLQMHKKMAYLRFWIQGKIPILLGILFLLLVSALLSINYIRTEISQHTGVAEAHTYVGTQFGNEERLAVTIENIGLVYVPITSISQVPVGSKVCIAKTSNLFGIVHHAYKHSGSCT